MKLIKNVLTKKDLQVIHKKFGDYIKLTIDLENESVIAGPKLHADAEKILIGEGCKQENIWGGGINFKDKIIDTTAVMNIRPNLANDSMEILDTERREKFVKITKKLFFRLWY